MGKHLTAVILKLDRVDQVYPKFLMASQLGPSKGACWQQKRSLTAFTIGWQNK